MLKSTLKHDHFASSTMTLFVDSSSNRKFTMFPSAFLIVTFWRYFVSHTASPSIALQHHIVRMYRHLVSPAATPCFAHSATQYLKQFLLVPHSASSRVFRVASSLILESPTAAKCHHPLALVFRPIALFCSVVPYRVPLASGTSITRRPASSGWLQTLRCHPSFFLKLSYLFSPWPDSSSVRFCLFQEIYTFNNDYFDWKERNEIEKLAYTALFSF